MALRQIGTGLGGHDHRPGLWALCAAAILVPRVYLNGLYQFATLPKLLLQVLACFLAFACLSERRVWLSRGSGFVLPLLLLLTITTAQAFRSMNPSEGLLVLAAQMSFGVVCLGAACLVAPGEEVLLLRFSAAAGLAVSVLGIAEHLGISPIVTPSAGRPSSTLGFRNVAGMYLAVNLPLSAVMLFRSGRWDRGLRTVAVGTMTAFLVLT